VEASLALKVNDSVVGYLMFGQMTDSSDKENMAKELIKYCSDYGIPESDIEKAIDEIKYTDNEKILAAAKILEACMSYIMLKELITPENDRIFVEAKEYIEEHLSRPLEIYEICSHLKISRTKLYEIFRKEADIGVSEYIRKRRMHKAKKLLRNTKTPVWEVAQAVGFEDYTYFSRVFKSVYGKSPREMRKEDDLSN
jgi:AraC-like DNA-binding protein